MANILDWRILVLWAISLIGVGATAAAQRLPGAPVNQMPTLLLENQSVLTGEEIGFRVERVVDGVPVGHVVVRVDGRWVDTQAR
jgi:hypothetical protein